MTRINKILILFLALVIPVWTSAGPVPDTGQTKCYNDTSEITCPQPGQPFYGQDANYTINPSSYTKLDANGNDLPDDATQWVMVRDNVTGLIWEVKQAKDDTPDYSNPHDADNTYTWYNSNPETNGGDAGTPGDGTDTEDFINSINSVNYGGYSDWWLPSREELRSIVDYGRSDPSADTAFFPNINMVAFYYWSSTTSAGGAWGVNFLTGSGAGPGEVKSKSSSYYVRAVRGVQSGSLGNFVIDGDDTVTDNLTGLMWQQNTAPGSYNWQQALSYCENLTLAGHSDWRLPTINELASIVDLGRHNPAVNTTFFSNTVASNYWLSTTCARYTDCALLLYFGDGSGNFTGKSTSFYVRAVRGGQPRLLEHLVILAPIQGSGWVPGSIKSIIWETRDMPGNVKIILSRQGCKDGTFETITESTENDGSYSWTVTNPISYKCMIKIEPFESGYENKGTIQGLFTIGNPSMSINPPFHNFDTQIVGETPPTQTFTISNTGNGELAINTISITSQDNSDFSITIDYCSGQPIQPSSSCTVDVKFSPTSAGAKSAYLSITSNDPTEPSLDVSLIGVGLDPAQLSVTPVETFESTGYPGGPFSPANKTYTLTNLGDITFDWTASRTREWITLSSEAGTLNSGESTTVEVSINDFANSLVQDTYTDSVLFVNTTNGNGNTARVVILDVTKESTDISCTIPSNEVVFGTSFTVSGTIHPPPVSANEGVSIRLIPSSGDTVFLSTNVDENGQFSLEVECSDFTGSGSWSVETYWAGDAIHFGDTSDPDQITVNQSGSSITLDIVMSEAIKINNEPPIGGNLSPTPFCDSRNLEGIPITLRITEPNTTEHLIPATTNPNGQFLLDYSATGFVFNEIGGWSIKAEFVGSAEYAASNSDEITVRVVPTSGYAVIIQGKTLSGEGLASHIKTTNFVYDKLIERQLLPDDIYYFGWDEDNPKVDGLPSKTDIETAITQTIKDKMIANAGDLYIIMVNHGWTALGDDEEGVFYIDPYGSITSNDLYIWLNQLQTSLVGTPAKDRKIVVILGFCRAGAFVDDINGTNRIIIASAAKNEYSHRGPQDVADDGVTPLRDGEYFVSEFFKNVAYGKPVKGCFENATKLIEEFTSKGSGVVNEPFYDDSSQHPLLDDNWDGAGSNELSDMQGEDGYNSRFIFIGTSPATGNDPGDVLVTEVSEAQFLGTEDSTVNIWGEVDEPGDARIIWVEVKAPNYDPGEPGEGKQIEMDTFKKATVDTAPDNNNRFVWNNLGGGSDPADLFSEPGTYQVFYFAKDNISGNLSPLMETRVYKAKTGNSEPTPFTLVYPDADDPVRTTLMLDWTDSSDPDGDSFSYSILFSKNDNSFAAPIRIEGVEHSSYLVGSEVGLDDLSTYYWKVQAIDEYGAIRESGIWSFNTDNTNPVVAWFKGYIYNSSTNQTIADAAVLIDNSTIGTDSGGYYLGEITPGSHTFTVTTAGYSPANYEEVLFQEGSLMNIDFGLAPTGTVMKGDVNGDGNVDLADVILALKVLCGVDTGGDTVKVDADVNDDGRIGLQEVIRSLQVISGVQ